MHQSYTTINHILRQAYYTKNDSCALKIVLKEIMETQHKSKRLTLRRGKQGLTCARAFHFYKDRSKIILRGVCCCQRMVMGTLTTSPTGLSRAAPMNYLHIYVALLPTFLSQTMANRILGCLPTISYHEGVPFYFSFIMMMTLPPTFAYTSHG